MGQDKALLAYHGLPQGAYCQILLKKVCSEVYISCRKDQNMPEFSKSDNFIYDMFDNVGPLGGILSAMQFNPAVSWLVLACDLPLVNAEHLQYLIYKRDSAKIATVFASGNAGLPEPLCGIYEPGHLKYWLGKLASDVRCPRKILLQSDIFLVNHGEEPFLQNINHPAEYKAIRGTISDE